MQDGVVIQDKNITGTLKYIEGGIAQSGPLAGSGNFLALKFDADWSKYTSVKIGLQPSKGTGLVELGKCLGIQRDEIMACGDGNNDEAMLREVGFGVAMANATDFVKAAANYITGTNDEEGAARAIERFALKGERIC